MGSIGRYIFRTTFGAFLVVCTSVTALIWITQALRDIDLMTNQGQSILVFIGITGLIIPLLVLIIAPIALMIAVAHVLNKLGNDSELIVMNAAGMSPWRLFRPFLAVGIVVSLLVAAISIYVSPWGLRELRRWATEVRADLVTNIVQPGRFTKIERQAHAAHSRAQAERAAARHPHRRPARPEGARDHPRRAGRHREERARHCSWCWRTAACSGTRPDSAIRRSCCSTATHSTCRRSPSGPQNVKYSVRERYLWELYDPTRTDTQFADQPGQFRAEFHDRITAPLYPLAFVVMTFAYLGAPRTTRQSRTMSLLGAISVVAALRGLGFVGMIAGVHTPIALLLPYLALAASFVLGYLAISRGVIIEPPAFITNAITAITERIAQRTGALMGQAP